jgi:signal transduction histidine kinase
VEALSEGQPMRVDVPRLQLVLVNLISNAVEHSQPGQRVRVSSPGLLIVIL